MVSRVMARVHCTSPQRYISSKKKLKRNSFKIFAYNITFLYKISEKDKVQNFKCSNVRMSAPEENTYSKAEGQI